MNSRSLPLVLVVLISVVTMPASVAWAESLCFEEAGKAYNISPDLLRGIARVESSLNPVALNYNTNGTFDVGLMQVNSAWRKIIGEDFWQMALESPCGNIFAGAHVLSICIRDYGYTWQAVGCYHSRTKKRSTAYAWKVLMQVVRR